MTRVGRTNSLTDRNFGNNFDSQREGNPVFSPLHLCVAPFSGKKYAIIIRYYVSIPFLTVKSNSAGDAMDAADALVRCSCQPTSVKVANSFGHFKRFDLHLNLNLYSVGIFGPSLINYWEILIQFYHGIFHGHFSHLLGQLLTNYWLIVGQFLANFAMKHLIYISAIFVWFFGQLLSNYWSIIDQFCYEIFGWYFSQFPINYWSIVG